MDNLHLQAHKQEFSELGYTIVRQFLPLALAKALRKLVDEDDVFQNMSHDVEDASGRLSRLTLWYEQGDDAFGRLSSCKPLHEQIAYFLGADVSFFHAKLMEKVPQLGGSWEWHQDYGYWHRDGFLKPSMASCYIALDDATVSNGCLELIPSSHLYQRIDHGVVGGQTGADIVVVEELLRRHGKIQCELNQGDALYFHANTLHCSGPNNSLNSRMGLISSFFTRDNESISLDPRYQNKVSSLCSIEDILTGNLLSKDNKSFLIN